MINKNVEDYHIYIRHDKLCKAGFTLRRNIPRGEERLLSFHKIRQKRALKSLINFNFSATEKSANILDCVPRDI